jgi:hypothetical protein
MLLNAFSQFGEWIRENKEVVKIFMVELGIALGVIAVETFPIFATATAVTVLAAAIAGLVQDFNVWRKGGDSLIEWDSWEVGITAATFGVLALTRTIMALGTAMESSVIAKGATFIGNIGSLVAKLGVFTALMFHSPELNTDENEKLKKQKLLSPTVDGKNNGARTNTTPPKGSAAYLGSIEQKYGLPKGLLDSVWNTESGRGKHMNSPVGAQGHFQFMPATSKQYGLRNPYDFESSADAAGRMYRDLIDKYHGDTNKALAAYNWGQGNVDKKGMGRLPLETSGYINKVLNGMPSMSNLANSSAASKQGGAIGANVSTTETHIGEVKIYTQTSNDASVIAKDIKSAVDKTFTSSQANYGMN